MESLKEAEEVFSMLDPTEKMEALIDYAKELPHLPEELKTKENEVPGCISLTYLAVKVEKGKVYFKGYSDALIVKGFLALLINEFDSMEKEDFLRTSEEKVEDFLKKTELRKSVTPSRANVIGEVLHLMIRRVKQC